MINSLFSQTFQVDVSVAVEDRKSISMLDYMSALLGLRSGCQDIKRIFFQGAGPDSSCRARLSVEILIDEHENHHNSPGSRTADFALLTAKIASAMPSPFKVGSSLILRPGTEIASVAGQGGKSWLPQNNPAQPERTSRKQPELLAEKRPSN